MKDLKASFLVEACYEEGYYTIEIREARNVWGMNLAEARSVSFHEAIEQAFESLALNDTDYIEASLEETK